MRKPPYSCPSPSEPSLDDTYIYQNRSYIFICLFVYLFDNKEVEEEEKVVKEDLEFAITMLSINQTNYQITKPTPYSPIHLSSFQQQQQREWGLSIYDEVSNSLPPSLRKYIHTLIVCTCKLT